MQSTITDLLNDLQAALETAGLRTKSAAHMVRLLPPAGRHELLTALRDNPDAMRVLANTYIGDIADRLRTTHADADVVRTYCRWLQASRWPMNDITAEHLRLLQDPEKTLFYRAGVSYVLDGAERPILFVRSNNEDRIRANQLLSNGLLERDGLRVRRTALGDEVLAATL